LERELRNALDKVRAEETLKRKTADFLRAEIARRGRGRFHPRRRRPLAALCAAFAVLMAFGGFSLYFTPAAHIDFDVNPSVGLAVNRLGFVIAAAAYNEDGSDILRSVRLKNKPYGEAAQTLMSAFIAQGYLAADGLVSATVQAAEGGDRESRMLDALAGAVRSSLASHRLSAQTEFFPVDADVLNAAHGHHLTPAKYLAITRLRELDPAVTFESCAEHGIGEIRELINSHDAQHHGEGGGAEHQGGGHGHD
jgi:hypothetical protein